MPKYQRWLVRKRGKKSNKFKSHVWNGDDTSCRMSSTGGLKMDLYEIRDAPGEHEVCHMCQLLSSDGR